MYYVLSLFFYLVVDCDVFITRGGLCAAYAKECVCVNFYNLHLRIGANLCSRM